jgi:hypothetical protein
MLDLKDCPKCGQTTSHRDGVCVVCRPTDTLNLTWCLPAPVILARIANHLETWGRITIENSAITEFPGQCALLLGMQVEKTGKVVVKDGTNAR